MSLQALRGSFDPELGLSVVVVLETYPHRMLSYTKHLTLAPILANVCLPCSWTKVIG